MTTFVEAGQISKEEMLKMAAESEGPQKAFYHLLAAVAVPMAEWIGIHCPVLSRREIYEVFNNYAAHIIAEALENVTPAGCVIDTDIAAEEFKNALEANLSGLSEPVAWADAPLNRA